MTFLAGFIVGGVLGIGIMAGIALAGAEREK